MRKTSLALASIVAVGLMTGPAPAGRPPNPEERAAVEQALTAQGYVSWEEIEYDEGLWEVDDARTADGREYDLRLDPDTLAVLHKDDEKPSPRR